MEIVRVAVLGVGNIGRQHARIYHGLATCELVGVADVDVARANRVANEFNCRAFPDHRALLAAQRPDAVSVSVPTSFHRQVATDALSSGVAVLVEKPIADTPEAARAIIAVAERSGVALAVGHVERFNPAVRALKRLVTAGGLGDILSVAARRVGVVPPASSTTNVIIDLAVHDIDVVSYLLDQAPVLRDVMRGRAWMGQHDDWADLLLAYGAASCVIQVNWLTPIKVRTLSVTGTNGYAELDYVSQSLAVYETSSLREVRDFAEFLTQYATPARHQVRIERDEPLRLELASFIRGVADDERPEVDGHAGLVALSAAFEAANRAAPALVR